MQTFAGTINKSGALQHNALSIYIQPARTRPWCVVASTVPGLAPSFALHCLCSHMTSTSPQPTSSWKTRSVTAGAASRAASRAS